MANDAVQAVGIRAQTVTAGANYIEDWGANLLVPIIANSSATPEGELNGVQEFLTLISNKAGITISTPEDVWKYTTFIEYTADSRDVAVLNLSNSEIISQPVAFSLATNILQSANYTLTTFSGECSAFARLYAATQSVLGSTTVYSVYIQGSSASHAANVFYYTNDPSTWYLMDYDLMYIGNSPWQLVAYLWSTTYQYGWTSDYYITFVQDIFYNGKILSSYLNPIACDSLSDLIANEIVSVGNAPTSITNFSTTSQWAPTQTAANNYFQIAPIASPSILQNITTFLEENYIFVLGVIGILLFLILT